MDTIPYLSFMTANTYILQIETATPVCSVAISKNGHIAACVEADTPNIHASHLTLFIEEALTKAAISEQELSAVAVSMGPGSYTGLRIGVSTAKGLCYALDIPLIAINTLASMAAGRIAQEAQSQDAIRLSQETILMPMIDARRMEVYTAAFGSDMQCLEATSARIIDQDSFAGEEGKNYLLFGSGADKFEELFADNPAVQVQCGFRNSASFFGQLAFEKYQQQTFEDVIYFEPYYLKDFMVTMPKKR